MVGLVLFGAAGPAGAQAPKAEPTVQERAVVEAQAALEAGLAFLGSFEGDGLDPGIAPYALEAAAAAGDAGEAVRRLARESLEVPTEGYMAVLRPAHALAIAGYSLRFEHRDIGNEVLAGFDGEQFGDPAFLHDDVWAVMALRHAGLPLADDRLVTAAQLVVAGADPAGGWSWQYAGTAETDTTGMAVEMLYHMAMLGSVDAETVLGALRQAKDGDGYALAADGQANCDSTVWALRAQARLGHPLDGDAWDFLLALQRDDGSLEWRPGTGANLLCTAEALWLLGDVAQGRLKWVDAEPEAPSQGVPVPPWVGAAALGIAALGARRRQA